MSGRSTDPNTRRLRRFVLLVIFAVTLPSLMLSGFGLIAIDNERDAARQRVLELYAPVVRKLAVGLEDQLKALVEASDRPLELLARWGLREAPPPGAEFVRFLQRHRSLANFFVIRQGGEVLLPRKEPPLPSFGGYLPESFRRGRRLEFERNDPAAAVAVYRSLLGEMDGESVRCKMMNSVRLSLGRPDLVPVEPCQAADAGESDHSIRCLARNALARSLDRAGRRAEAAQEWGRLMDSCPRFVDLAGYNPALGARLRRLELLWPGRAEEALADAVGLAGALADPLLPASDEQKRFAGSRAAALLAGAGRGRARALRGFFEHVATGHRLLAAGIGLDKAMDEGIELRSVPLDGVRRMLVVRKCAGVVAGAELVAPMIEPDLQALLSEMEIGPNVVARISPTTRPADDEIGLLAGSALLTDGQFAWRLDLWLMGSDALDTLARTRARPPGWILVMLVLVLALGIVGTVWVMVRETRLSRLKTDFVSSVSHELRTPLTSIRLFTETLLLGRAGSGEEQKEFLEIISRESERLSRLVERILDFSRMEAGRKAYSFQPVAVQELVRSALSACRSLIADRDASLTCRLPDELSRVEVDRDSIVEVMINLLSNAIKYGPAGGEVTVEARQDGDWLELSVGDRGIGIPRAEQSRIFDKFYRVETPLASEVSGSGLGLSLVRYIVEGHGGEVRVDSAPGKGSTFTVRLPSEHDETRKDAP